MYFCYPPTTTPLSLESIYVNRCRWAERVVGTPLVKQSRFPQFFPLEIFGRAEHVMLKLSLLCLCVFDTLGRSIDTQSAWWLAFSENSTFTNSPKFGFSTCCSYAEPLRSTARRRTQLAFAVHTFKRQCIFVTHPPQPL